jgi:hypothetical protein
MTTGPRIPVFLISKCGPLFFNNNTPKRKDQLTENLNRSNYLALEVTKITEIIIPIVFLSKYFVF